MAAFGHLENVTSHPLDLEYCVIYALKWLEHLEINKRVFFPLNDDLHTKIQDSRSIRSKVTFSINK